MSWREVQAPYITEAERNGMPEAPDVLCPICGKVADDIFEDVNGYVCGCDECIKVYDAFTYADEKGWF